MNVIGIRAPTLALLLATMLLSMATASHAAPKRSAIIPDSNFCGLYDYFQYIFEVPTRPFDCNNIPPEFYVYQTDVGEAASSGSSSGGSAASAASGAAVGSSATATPTATLTHGAAVMYFDGSVRDQQAAKAIDNQYGDQGLDALPPLERSFWVKLLGSWGSKDETTEDPSLKVKSHGLMAGTDLISTAYFRLGVIGSINYVDIEVNENDMKLEMVLPKVGVTTTIEVDDFYFDAMGMYGPEHYDTSRVIDIDNNGDLRPMWSKYTNHRISSAFEFGYRTSLGQIVVQPFAGANMNWLYQDDVIEKGNEDAAIHTASTVTFSGTSKLGVNLSTAFHKGRVSFVPTIGGYWSRRFGKISKTSKISVDSGNSFKYVGSALPLDLFNLNAGLVMNLDESFAFSGSYSATFNASERIHAVGFGLRYRF